MLVALILTVILECLVLVLLKERDKLFYVYWLAVTSFTNISVNLFLAFVFQGGIIEYWLTVLLIEIIVYIVEALLCLLYTNDKRKSLIYSLVCNSASFFIGLLIQMIFY